MGGLATLFLADLEVQVLCKACIGGFGCPLCCGLGLLTCARASLKSTAQHDEHVARKFNAVALDALSGMLL